MTTPEPEAVEPVADPHDPGPVPGEDDAGALVDDVDPADTDPDIDVELPQRPALDPEAGPQDGGEATDA